MQRVISLLTVLVTTLALTGCLFGKKDESAPVEQVPSQNEMPMDEAPADGQAPDEAAPTEDMPAEGEG